MSQEETRDIIIALREWVVEACRYIKEGSSEILTQNDSLSLDPKASPQPTPFYKKFGYTITPKTEANK